MLNRNTSCCTYHRLLEVGVDQSTRASQFVTADAPAALPMANSGLDVSSNTLPPKFSASLDPAWRSHGAHVPHYRMADCLAKCLLGVGMMALGCTPESNAWTRTERVFWVGQYQKDLGAMVVAGGPTNDTLVLTSTRRQGSAGTGRGYLYQLNSDAPRESVERLSCQGEHCDNVSSGAAFWGGDVDGQSDACFVLGVSKLESGQVVNLWCRDAGERTREAPPTESTLFVPQLVFGSDTGTRPGFIASWAGERRFWYFPGNGDAASEHVAEVASASKSWGESIAVLPLGSDQYSSRLVAIGARDEGEVWLYRSEFPEPAQLKRVGCLGAYPGFGRKLVAGDLDADGVGDLLVLDDTHVTAFSGHVLSVLGPQTDPSCDLEALPAGAVMASVSCASGGVTSGCARADFGAAVVIADLDGDGDGEIVVGAPGMDVYDNRSVGAVLIYDVEGDDPNALTEQLVVTDLEPDARFGAGIGVASGRNSDHLVVGAPGYGRIAVASCFQMTRPELRPKWCPAELEE